MPRLAGTNDTPLGNRTFVLERVLTICSDAKVERARYAHAVHASVVVRKSLGSWRGAPDAECWRGRLTGVDAVALIRCGQS